MCLLQTLLSPTLDAYSEPRSSQVLPLTKRTANQLQPAVSGSSAWHALKTVPEAKLGEKDGSLVVDDEDDDEISEDTSLYSIEQYKVGKFH